MAERSSCTSYAQLTGQCQGAIVVPACLRVVPFDSRQVSQRTAASGDPNPVVQPLKQGQALLQFRSGGQVITQESAGHSGSRKRFCQVECISRRTGQLHDLLGDIKCDLRVTLHGNDYREDATRLGNQPLSLVTLSERKRLLKSFTRSCTLALETIQRAQGQNATGI